MNTDKSLKGVAIKASRKMEWWLEGVRVKRGFFFKVGDIHRGCTQNGNNLVEGGNDDPEQRGVHAGAMCWSGQGRMGCGAPVEVGLG